MILPPHVIRFREPLLLVLRYSGSQCLSLEIAYAAARSPTWTALAALGYDSGPPAPFVLKERLGIVLMVALTANVDNTPLHGHFIRLLALDNTRFTCSR